MQIGSKKELGKATRGMARAGVLMGGTTLDNGKNRFLGRRVKDLRYFNGLWPSKGSQRTSRWSISAVLQFLGQIRKNTV